MNANSTTNVSPEHPSPGRRQINGWWLLFGLVAAPFAWSLAELFSYGIVSYTCRMKTSGQDQTLSYGGSWWLWVVFIVCLAIAIAGSAVAIGNWRKTRREKGGSGHHLLELGEGRSRFIAMCSMLTSIGFLIGFVFLLNTMITAPLCVK
jgi:hypothetical protein